MSCTLESHTALKRDLAAWFSLPYVGVMDYDDRGTKIELRNCRCGSTLCKTVRRAVEVVL